MENLFRSASSNLGEVGGARVNPKIVEMADRIISG
jgi:RNase P/RNase MRP subunit POP5